nr:hypothetical protein CFP56_23853 [Quercus suber]
MYFHRCSNPGTFVTTLEEAKSLALDTPLVMASVIWVFAGIGWERMQAALGLTLRSRKWRLVVDARRGGVVAVRACT